MLEPNRVMIRAVAACFVAAALCASVAAGQKKTAEPASVRQIRATLERQVAAWNRRDLEAFMAGYWRSPELSFYSGSNKTSSWQKTLEGYRARYQGEGREMGQLDFSELEIEMLGPASAFVRGRWRLKMQSGEPGGLFTLIFRKFRDGWKIVHDHTC
jgi:ketosteroid isomerase-like protein